MIFLNFRTVEVSWFENFFSSQSSQETKVVYQKTEDEKYDETDDKPEREDEKIMESEFKIDETQSSQSSHTSWWRSWSTLSSQYSGQKRELSNDEEEEDDDDDDEKGWQLFCSSPDKKEKEKEQPMEILTQTTVDKDDNKKDDNKKDDDEEDNDEGKVEFFVRVGENKRFKYY